MYTGVFILCLYTLKSEINHTLHICTYFVQIVMVLPIVQITSVPKPIICGIELNITEMEEI